MNIKTPIKTVRLWFRLHKMDVICLESSLNQNPERTWFYIDLNYQGHFDYYSAANRLEAVVGAEIWRNLRNLKVDFSEQTLESSLNKDETRTELNIGLLLSAGAKFVVRDSDS